MLEVISSMGEIIGLSSCIYSKVVLTILLLVMSIFLQSPNYVLSFRPSTRRTTHTGTNKLNIQRSRNAKLTVSDERIANDESSIAEGKAIGFSGGYSDKESSQASAPPSLRRKIIEEVATVFGKRKEIVKQLLDEFSQPFMGTSSPSSSEYDDMDPSVIVECNEASLSSSATTTHFAFLVHGYNGNPADLVYLRTAMAANAEKRLNQIKRDNPSKYTEQNKIVIHTCQSNVGSTKDGIENGGKRIMEEVLSVIQEHASSDDKDSDEITDITVSFVGNSLGGLYSRYAIARLSELSNVTATDVGYILLEGKIRLHFNIFCSTATPHLGISGHLYFPLPRSAEIGIATFMG